MITEEHVDLDDKAAVANERLSPEELEDPKDRGFDVEAIKKEIARAS